ncbi:unnamed protein product [Gongylonema pulchrum]|uniref:Ribosomal_S4 domain-containing protein n=1 Tax=Gongylonema pulchrum TaxID=637853 RepID=A0A183EQ83_9BILA|nr:unnamed protein product [Gongylonema pulchrum]
MQWIQAVKVCLSREGLRDDAMDTGCKGDSLLFCLLRAARIQESPAMVRKLKFHEKKLLKKVDFISWELDNNLHEAKILRRYNITKRQHYSMYNTLAANVSFMICRRENQDKISQDCDYEDEQIPVHSVFHPLAASTDK